MRLSAELSLYPLNADFAKIVLAFIDDLLAEEDVSAVTNSMSTQIHGDTDAVFNAIRRALEASCQRYGKQVLVAKFIPEHLERVEPSETA
jgi:uncharacterized protein YqgV (UPF0045/DUF77 family)